MSSGKPTTPAISLLTVLLRDVNNADSVKKILVFTLGYIDRNIEKTFGLLTDLLSCKAGRRRHSKLLDSFFLVQRLTFRICLESLNYFSTTPVFTRTT